MTVSGPRMAYGLVFRAYYWRGSGNHDLYNSKLVVIKADMGTQDRGRGDDDANFYQSNIGMLPLVACLLKHS